MTEQAHAMCPLFPDLICPQGQEASEQCSVRVNGEFDPVHYFRDELIMHCAIYQSEQKSAQSEDK